MVSFRKLSYCYTFKYFCVGFQELLVVPILIIIGNITGVFGIFSR